MQNISFHHDTLGQGVRILYARLPCNPFPVGFIWHNGAQHGVTALAYIWVHNDARRQGIGAALIRELQSWLPGRELFTEQTFCEPFLLATGFKKSPDGWRLLPSETTK